MLMQGLSAEPRIGRLVAVAPSPLVASYDLLAIVAGRPGGKARPFPALPAIAQVAFFAFHVPSIGTCTAGQLMGLERPAVA